jgi:sorbitol-specific phosphotransferase system component IIBC
MTPTRLIGLLLILVLITRLLPLLSPFLSARLRAAVRRYQLATDLVGGAVMIGLIAVQLAYRNYVNAIVLLLLGVPVFWGSWKALPAWWRGEDA